MSMPRPPLSDIDYTAACENAAKALCQLHTDHTSAWQEWMAEGTATVDAVWPILHEAAYTAGQASILDEAEEQWAVRAIGTDIVFGVAPTEQGCRDWCDERPRYEPVRRHVTEWQPIEEAIP